jgi:hypothetical protein
MDRPRIKDGVSVAFVELEQKHACKVNSTYPSMDLPNGCMDWDKILGDVKRP